MAGASRQQAFSGSPYEPVLGISRAVRVGQFISVAGTAPLGPDGKTVGKGDPGAQAERCLEIIREAVEKLGASLSDVVRTRILLTRIQDWEAVGRVHGGVFQAVQPVTTIVQVVRFVDPDWLVEIEADAVSPG
jgi:enamine deaminase RidA (YjgF/YER057c/UK114 family)